MKIYNVLAVLALVFIILAYGLLGNMDRKMMDQAEAWERSVQALQMEQEDLQSRILETQAILKDTEDRTISQGILISEIWERLHLDFFLAADKGVLE